MKDPDKLILHVENVGGNLFDAAFWVNRQGWAEAVVRMDYGNGNTQVVLRLPKHEVVAHMKRQPGYTKAGIKRVEDY